MTTAVAVNAESNDIMEDIDLNLDGNPPNEAADEAAADAAATVEAEGDVAEDSPEVAELKAELQKLRDELAVKNDLENQITKASRRVERLAAEVESAESAVEEAKGDLKSAKERYETGMRELRSLIKDKGRGQGRLPLQGKENDAAPPVVAEDGQSSPSTAPTSLAPDEHASSPISVLGQKQMIALVGQDTWEAAKNREEPFGLGKVELETLEAAEIATIGELEKKMREDAYWHQKIPKFGEKKVAKLIETLRVWRGKFPMPEGK